MSWRASFVAAPLLCCWRRWERESMTRYVCVCVGGGGGAMHSHDQRSLTSVSAASCQHACPAASRPVRQLESHPPPRLCAALQHGVHGICFCVFSSCADTFASRMMPLSNITSCFAQLLRAVLLCHKRCQRTKTLPRLPADIWIRHVLRAISMHAFVPREQGEAAHEEAAESGQ